MRLSDLIEWLAELFAILVAALASVVFTGHDVGIKAELPELPSPPVVTGPAAPTAKTSFGNGVFEVGVDIQPGTYVTAGPLKGRICYWARLKSFDGDGISNIIDNRSSLTGQSIVTIRRTDGGFESSGCKRWKRR